MSETRPLGQRLILAMATIAVGGLVCIAAMIVLGLLGLIFHGSAQFFRSWLFAWIFWLGVSLGSLGIIMMHHLTGGGWGYMVRRFGENAAMCLPLMVVLFIPIFIGARTIYPWADSNEVAHDAVLRHQEAHWLNWEFWTIRSLVYLLLFCILGWLMQTRSLERTDVDAGPILARLRRVGAAGLVIYFFVMGLGSVDWIMSRQPHWYSTVFGFIVCISQAVSAACFLILMVWLFADEPPLKRVIHPNYLNDLGNVLLTFVILWAYLSFAQFLVTWVGNSQDEITWYIQRTDGGWRWVAAALIMFHFLVPFFILLQRPLKRKTERLACIAAGLFFIHIIDELYWVTPADPHGSVWNVGRWIYAEAMNLLAFGGIGGLWLAMFLWMTRSRPLLPIGERIPVTPIDHGHGQRPTPGTVE